MLLCWRIGVISFSRPADSELTLGRLYELLCLLKVGSQRVRHITGRTPGARTGQVAPVSLRATAISPSAIVSQDRPRSAGGLSFRAEL
jgi:hypothetical protein